MKCFDGWVCTTIKTGNPRSSNGAVSDQIETNSIDATWCLSLLLDLSSSFDLLETLLEQSPGILVRHFDGIAAGARIAQCRVR